MTFPKEFPKGYFLYDTRTRTTRTRSASPTSTRSAATRRSRQAAARRQLDHRSSTTRKLDANKKPVIRKDWQLGSRQVMSYAGMSRAPAGAKISPSYSVTQLELRLVAPTRRRREINQAVCLACHKPTSANQLRVRLEGDRDQGEKK